MAQQHVDHVASSACPVPCSRELEQVPMLLRDTAPSALYTTMFTSVQGTSAASVSVGILGSRPYNKKEEDSKVITCILTLLSSASVQLPVAIEDTPEVGQVLVCCTSHHQNIVQIHRAFVSC